MSLQSLVDLMPCLENLVPVKEDLSTPRVQVTILDVLASSTCCDQGLQRHSKVMLLTSLQGKKTAWDTWTTYGDVTPAFCALGATPDSRAIDEWMQPLE